MRHSLDQFFVTPPLITTDIHKVSTYLNNSKLKTRNNQPAITTLQSLVFVFLFPNVNNGL